MIILDYHSCRITSSEFSNYINKLFECWVTISMIIVIINTIIKKYHKKAILSAYNGKQSVAMLWITWLIWPSLELLYLITHLIMVIFVYVISIRILIDCFIVRPFGKLHNNWKKNQSYFCNYIEYLWLIIL